MPGLKGGINRGARVPSIFALASSCAASSRFSSPVCLPSQRWSPVARCVVLVGQHLWMPLNCINEGPWTLKEGDHVRKKMEQDEEKQ
jgi:hypothetical protein